MQNKHKHVFVELEQYDVKNRVIPLVNQRGNPRGGMEWNDAHFWVEEVSGGLGSVCA